MIATYVDPHLLSIEEVHVALAVELGNYGWDTTVLGAFNMSALYEIPTPLGGIRVGVEVLQGGDVRVDVSDPLRVPPHGYSVVMRHRVAWTALAAAVVDRLHRVVREIDDPDFFRANPLAGEPVDIAMVCLIDSAAARLDRAGWSAKTVSRSNSSSAVDVPTALGSVFVHTTAHADGAVRVRASMKRARMIHVCAASEPWDARLHTGDTVGDMVVGAVRDVLREAYTP